MGVDQIQIDFAWVAHTFDDAGFGNFVEGNPIGLVHIQPNDVSQMPRNGFPFPVRVGSQINHFAFLSFFFQGFDEGFLPLDFGVLGGKSVVHIHPQLAFGKIADMPVGSQDFVVLSQVFLDGFSLGGRFHNDEF